MKYLKYMLCAIMLFAFCPLLSACGEVTLESIPWRMSANSEEDVIDMVEECTEYMFSGSASSASIPVTYKCTVTYNFHETKAGDFDNEEVRDDIVLSMTRYKGEVSPMAKLSITRNVDGQIKSREVRTYAKESSDMLCFVDRFTFEENNEINTKDMLSEYADVDYFLQLVGEVVKYSTLGNASRVQTKNFESVTYHRLSLSSANNANNLKRLFDSNSNIRSNPSLFQMYDKVMDTVSSMDYQYGINDDREGYLSYFAMNYSLSRYVEGFDGERETYLDVNVVTKLDKKGEEIEKIEEVEDKGEYTCANFLGIVNSNQNYVTYRQNEDASDLYQQISISRNNEDVFVKIEQFSAGVLNKSNVYTIINDEVYSLDTIERTYTKVAEDGFALPAVVYFDYTLQYTSKDTESGSYIYGAGDDSSLVLTIVGESISTVSNGSDTFDLIEYDRTVKSDLNIKLTSYTLIE